MFNIFNRKYIKALREIDAEITQYNVALTSYEKIRDDIRKFEPENREGLESAEHQVDQYRARLYALRRLRDRLIHTVG